MTDQQEQWLTEFVAKLKDAKDMPDPFVPRDPLARTVLIAKHGTANFILGKLKELAT